MSWSWWSGRRAITALTVLCIAVFTAHAVLRYLSYHSPAYDLGFFDQLTANLSTGRGWQSSFIGYDFRGQHWEPILLVWAQLYRIAASPLWLVGINAVALGLTPLAAWRLARSWLGREHPGALAAAVATALSPLVLRTAGFDYHSEALTPLLALVALDAAFRHRWLVVASCCAVLVLLKEDALLVVAGIGWLIWCRQGRRAGLVLTAAGLAGFALLVTAVMPRFRGGAPSDLLARYAYLSGSPAPASTPAEVVAGMVTHPGAWLGHLLAGASLRGWAVALLPLALLPALAGWSLLGAAPPLLLALLSADPYQASLQFHYGIEAFPLLLACALLGWPRARRMVGAGWWRGRLAITAAVVVAVVVVSLSIDARARLDDLGGLDRADAVNAALGRLPDSDAVSASTELVPHLSERPVITEFPDTRRARWVVIDGTEHPSDQAIAAGYTAAIASLPQRFHVVWSAAGLSIWMRS